MNAGYLCGYSGVRLNHLIPGTYQINLFEDTQEMIRLYQSIDSIKKQFEEDKIVRATTIHKK
jgi:DNA polymerase-4